MSATRERKRQRSCKRRGETEEKRGERELVADPDSTSNAGQCAHRACIRVCTVCARTGGKQGERGRTSPSPLLSFLLLSLFLCLVSEGERESSTRLHRVPFGWLHGQGFEDDISVECQKSRDARNKYDGGG